MNLINIKRFYPEPPDAYVDVFRLMNNQWCTTIENNGVIYQDIYEFCLNLIVLLYMYSAVPPQFEQ